MTRCGSLKNLRKGCYAGTTNGFQWGCVKILIKSILESILVYQMGLSRIPKSILNMMRRCAFRFLWTGNRKKYGFHLVNWGRLGTPKWVGGWVLKNIYNFAQSLVAKSLWRGLTTSRVWNNIICSKYLNNFPLAFWVRSPTSKLNGVSNICENLIKAWQIIEDWLTWALWDELLIRVGEDPIVGFNGNFQLSQELRCFLHRVGLFKLVQFVKNEHVGGLFHS